MSSSGVPHHHHHHHHHHQPPATSSSSTSVASAYPSTTSSHPSASSTQAGTTTGSASNGTNSHTAATHVTDIGLCRILCVADIRGNLSLLNTLAAETRATCIVHTGDFGFYDDRSLNRIAEKTLRHVTQYSPLIPESLKVRLLDPKFTSPLCERFPLDQARLSELTLFLNRTHQFNVPVYAVWGACEDVQVLERFRSGEYHIPNFHILDEAHTHALHTGGVKIRLLGLGGALAMHKLFDNGEGRTTIAGGQGTMWSTLLQIGELVDTARQVYDLSETRVLITHASPAREGLLNQLACALKADFTISAGLHFRYCSSYNEFSVNPSIDHWRAKMAAAKAALIDVWDTVKGEVEPAVSDNEIQRKLLDIALEVVYSMPNATGNIQSHDSHNSNRTSNQAEDNAFKNMWHFNLSDAAFGWLVLHVEDGRISTEMRAQGFQFAHRGEKTTVTPQVAGINAGSSNVENGVRLVPQNNGFTGGPATSKPSPASSIKPAAVTPATTTVTPTIPTTTIGSTSTILSVQGSGISCTSRESSLPTLPGPPPVTTNIKGSDANNTGSGVVRNGPNTNSAKYMTLTTENKIQTSATDSQTKPTNPSLENDLKSQIKSETRPNAISRERAGGGNSGGYPRKDNGRNIGQLNGSREYRNFGLYVRNVKDEASVRELLSDVDRAKVTRIEKFSLNFVVFFETHADMTNALANVDNEYKGMIVPGLPNFSIYRQGIRANYWVSNPRNSFTGGMGYRSYKSNNHGNLGSANQIPPGSTPGPSLNGSPNPPPLAAHVNTPPSGAGPASGSAGGANPVPPEAEARGNFQRFRNNNYRANGDRNRRHGGRSWHTHQSPSTAGPVTCAPIAVSSTSTAVPFSTQSQTPLSNSPSTAPPPPPLIFNFYSE